MPDTSEMRRMAIITTAKPPPESVRRIWGPLRALPARLSRPEEIDTDVMYDYDTDEWHPEWLEVTCPACGNVESPENTRSIEQGWQWFALSHKEPYELLETTCGECGQTFTFKTVTPQ